MAHVSTAIAVLALMAAEAVEPARPPQAERNPVQAARQAAETLDARGGSAMLIQLYDSSRDADTKETILRTLAEIHDARAVEKLKSVAAGDPDSDLRERAIRLLAERSEVSFLVQIYDAEKDADVKDRVLRLLAERDDETARKKLLAVAQSDPDRDLRERAIRELGRQP